MHIAGVESGTWTYDSSAPTGGRYPSIDLRLRGTLYRGYPRIPLAGTEPEPVKFTVSVKENAERIRGAFSGVLSEVDDRLMPNGAVATIMNGEFDNGEFDVVRRQPAN